MSSVFSYLLGDGKQHTQWNNHIQLHVGSLGRTAWKCLSGMCVTAAANLCTLPLSSTVSVCWVSLPLLWLGLQQHMKFSTWWGKIERVTDGGPAAPLLMRRTNTLFGEAQKRLFGKGLSSTKQLLLIFPKHQNVSIRSFNFSIHQESASGLGVLLGLGCIWATCWTSIFSETRRCWFQNELLSFVLGLTDLAHISSYAFHIERLDLLHILQILSWRSW